MGTQIEFAHSEQDELAFVESVLAKHDTRCLPAEFREPVPQVHRLGECQSIRQLLFPAECSDLVLRHVVAFPTQPDMFHIWPHDGMCLEWDRPRVICDQGVYGRLFLPTGRVIRKDTLKLLTALMRFAVRLIQSECPMQSDDTAPVYIGRHLSQMVADGTIRGIAYRGGQLMNLISNPHYKPKE